MNNYYDMLSYAAPLIGLRLLQIWMHLNFVFLTVQLNKLKRSHIV